MNLKALLEALATADDFIRDRDWWLSWQIQCGEDALRKLNTMATPPPAIYDAAFALIETAHCMQEQGLANEASKLVEAATAMKRPFETTTGRGLHVQ
jgi:hypothetical protein